MYLAIPGSNPVNYILDYYTCTIPTDSLPPSYRGTSIKYSNIFSLVLQKSASTHSGPPLVLTLPFKLMNPTSGLRRNEFQLGCPSFKFATSALPLPASHNFNSADFQSSDSSKPIKEKETRRIVKSVFEKFGKPGMYRAPQTSFFRMWRVDPIDQ